MKRYFIEWILFILLMILMFFKSITIAESIIIYSIAIGLEYILEELQKIRRLLECLNSPPFHINCRHQIIKNNENELYFDTNSFVETVKINYCPMCGRLVNKQVLEDIKKSIEDPTCGINAAIPVCNEIKLDMQEEINKAIEKSIFDRRKLYARGIII